MVWQFIDALSFSPRQGENSTIFIIFYFLFLICYFVVALTTYKSLSFWYSIRARKKYCCAGENFPV